MVDDPRHVPETEGVDFDPRDPIVCAMLVKHIVREYLLTNKMYKNELIAEAHAHVCAMWAGVGCAVMTGQRPPGAVAIDEVYAYVQDETKEQGGLLESLGVYPFVSIATAQAMERIARKMVEEAGEEWPESPEAGL